MGAVGKPSTPDYPTPSGENECRSPKKKRARWLPSPSSKEGTNPSPVVKGLENGSA
jgi:hypothetical protein